MRIAAMVFGMWLLVSPARGAESATARRVALFPVSGNGPLSSRLTAELAAQGFQVANAEEPSPDDASFRELREPMARVGASLALRLVVEPALVRLWLINVATAKELYREVPITAGAALDSAIISLWAVEALRASELPTAPLVEAHHPARPSSPQSAPTRSSSLQVAPAAMLSPGGLGASVHVAFGGRLLLTKELGDELLLAVPTFPVELERVAGSSRTWRGLVSGGAFLTTSRAGTKPALDVAAGAALLVTRTVGNGHDGYSGRIEHLLSLGPYARVGTSVPISHRFRLRVDGASGVAFPRPIVFFDEERVAAWGRPWFLLSLGAELVF